MSAWSRSRGSCPGKLLLVDDNPGVIRALSFGLTRAGFRVCTSHDGPSALRLLREDGEIAMLLSDVVMPGGMTGIELARAGRLARTSLLVLLTTGYAYDVFERLGSHPQEFPIIAKPYSVSALVARVDELFVQAQQAQA